MALVGYNLSSITDLTDMFHSQKIRQASNISRISNKELDEILAETSNSMDEEEKIKNYQKLQKVLLDELPYVNLLFKRSATIVNHKIQGEMYPNYNNIYKGLDKSYNINKTN